MHSFSFILSHIFLVLACLALLGVIAAQDYLVPRLRAKPISTGLYGNPYKWYLNGSMVLLAVAVYGVVGFGGVVGIFAALTAISLVMVAATDTFHKLLDSLTHGHHEVLHLAFTGATFAGGAMLEVMSGHGWLLWCITVINFGLPLGLYLGTHRMDYVEKAAVLFLVIWLIVWAL